MNHTKEELINAIKTLAIVCKKEDMFNALLEENLSMPELIKALVYEMFIIKFNSYTENDKLFEAWKIIHEFVFELREKGFVTYYN